MYIKKIFGVSVCTLTKQSLLEKIDNIVVSQKKEILLPINTSSLLFMKQDKEYDRIMRNGSFVCADGMSIVWAARLKGINVPERLPTTDVVNYLFKYLCAKDKKYRVYFLGGKESVLQNAEAHFRDIYPALNIAGHYSPPFMSLEEMRLNENDKITSLVNSLSIDILFVGFGVPKQEKWCIENQNRLNTSLIIPCGGMFGFYGGEYRRAPKIMQTIGLEWLFRLCQEPKRLWRRYLYANSLFLWLLIKELFLKNYAKAS